MAPQIRKLFKDLQFDATTWWRERSLDYFEDGSKQLSWKPESWKLQELVEKMLSFYEKMGCNMSLKIHFLFPFSFWLFSRQLRFCKWRAWRTFLSIYHRYRNTLSRTMEPINVSRLLLECHLRYTWRWKHEEGNEAFFMMQRKRMMGAQRWINHGWSLSGMVFELNWWLLDQKAQALLLYLTYCDLHWSTAWMLQKPYQLNFTNLRVLITNITIKIDSSL